MSGENTQHSSNPTSDYDFAEIQQDPDEIEVNLMKHDLQKIDMNLMLVLNRFPLSDAIIGNFGLYQIKYSQLSSLAREDLLKLGIEDNKLQDEMLEEFQQLEGQEVSLKETLDNFQKSSPPPSTSRSKSIVDSLQDHLYRMNTLLAAVSFQLGATSSAASGVVINQRFCSTQVVLDLLGQLSTHTAEMEEIIKALKDPERFELSEMEHKRKKQRERRTNCMILVSAVGLFVAGFYMARRMGVRKIF